MCSLFFERFVLFFCLKIERFVPDSAEIWICGLYKGLKSQYLFIFAGGLVSVFLVVVILYMAGVSQWVCLTLGVFSGSLTVWMTFRLNARYGEHGLMKALAEKSHPRYLTVRRRIRSLLTPKKKKKK